MRVNSHGFYILNQDGFDYIMFHYFESSQETVHKYFNAYTFSTTVPMNKLYASKENKITVNGRSRPFASRTMYYENGLYINMWVLINPIYSINEDKRIVVVDREKLLNFSGPMPIECWKYYKAYYGKWKND